MKLIDGSLKTILVQVNAPASLYPVCQYLYTLCLGNAERDSTKLTSCYHLHAKDQSPIRSCRYLRSLFYLSWEITAYEINQRYANATRLVCYHGSYTEHKLTHIFKAGMKYKPVK